MKTLQKTLAAIFALLALALFVACSSDSADSSDSDSLGLAGTTWTSTYTTVDQDGTEQKVTTTIEFGNDGKSVTTYDTYIDDDDVDLEEQRDSGTYSVDGSRVILNLEKWGTYYFVYSDGQLVFAEVYTTDETGLGSFIIDSSLAGTTWECSLGFSYKNVVYTYTVTIEFGDDAKSVTMTDDTGDYYSNSADNKTTYEGTYSVDGSTVTLEFDLGTIKLTYSSGELVYCNDLMTFTKD